MKTTRRKELKTNELSVYLQEMYEAIQRHSKYIVGGVVVVALVLAIGWVVHQNRQARIQQAWQEYYNLKEKNVISEPGIIEQARALATSGIGDSNLSERAMELPGDLAYELAITLQDGDQKARRIELFKDARSTYEQVLDQYGSRPDVAARVRMSLASTEESLTVLGEGSEEKIRQLYKAVIDADANPFQADARRQLESLDERLRALKVIATRPAETPETNPATAPAVTRLELNPETTLTPVISTMPPVEAAPAAPPVEAPSTAPAGTP